MFVYITRILFVPYYLNDLMVRMNLIIVIMRKMTSG